MSLKPYPEYKESGVKWLGNVPAGWRIAPIKFISSFNDEVLPELTDPEYKFHYVEISDVSHTHGITFGEPITFADAASRARRVVREGDVLVSTVRTYLRAIAGARSIPSNTIASTGFAVLRPKNCDAQFLAYALLGEHSTGEIIARSVGVSYPAINATDLVKVKLPVPGQDEQHAIAEYLDRETDEIDAFIADQEELIALLAERRTATITQAVARGLHPDVRMVAGSLAEIGSVPIHWSVSRLKWGITKIESGTSVNAHDIPVKGTDEVGVLKTSCVYTGEFDPSKNKKVNVEDLHRVACPVQANTLIVSRMNTPQLVGAAGYAVRNEPNIYLPDRLWQVYFHESWEARFVHFWTQTRLYRAQVEAVCMGTSSSMQNIGQDDLRNFILHLPPKEEQREIVDYLKTATSDIDAAIADAREAIALSQERRAAVISAAVTGKIDVRGLVGPEANNVEGVSVGIA